MGDYVDGPIAPKAFAFGALVAFGPLCSAVSDAHTFANGPYNLTWHPDLASLTWRERDGACNTRLNEGRYAWPDDGGGGGCDDLAFTATVYLRIGQDSIAVANERFFIKPQKLDNQCRIDR